MRRFAILQLSGCAGCEVALLNAEAWIDEVRLVYMPLVVSSHGVPEVDVLFVSGGVRNEADRHHLRRAVRRAKEVVAVGTCALSGGVAHLGDRDDVRALYCAEPERVHLPHLLPRSYPVDDAAAVDRYLPGCPPTPELFLLALAGSRERLPATVCAECGRRKLKDRRPRHLVRSLGHDVEPGVCLINQGYLCLGSSTRGGCRALCTVPGHICVGCRGPSDAFIEKDATAWQAAIAKVFTAMTDVPAEEIAASLRSPQLAMFLFQFSDYDGARRPPRPKAKVL